MDILFYLMYTIPFFAFGMMIYFAVPFFRSADRMPWWEQAGRVVVLSLMFSVVAVSIFIGADVWDNLPGVAEYFSTFFFAGLFSLVTLRLSQYVTRSMNRFDMRQLIEFVAIVGGAVLGVLAANMVNYLILGIELFWRWDGFETLKWFDTYFVIIVASVMAFMRLLSNFQDLAHQNLETQRLRDMEQMQSTLDRAKLQAIQARLNPHFLYNSLNSMASQVHSHPDRAEQMCLDLARMFRELLDRHGEGPFLVTEAVDLLRTYLEIEKARFGDGLQYQVQVSPEAATWKLPRFLMQPLVENAVLHAKPPVGQPINLDIDARVNHGCLVLTVADNGGPFPDPIPGGFGLQSVSDTLELLYPKQYSIEFRNPPLKAVVLTLKSQSPNS